MITLKQNRTHDRASKQAKSFTRSAAHVIAALMLTSVWKAAVFFSMCNLAVMSEDLTLGWGYQSEAKVFIQQPCAAPVGCLY